MVEATDTTARAGIDRRSAVVWFVIGTLVALAMQWIQVQTLGGEWNSLLSTWDEGTLRPVIEEQLGDVTVVGGGGHDGQAGYVVALDPLGSEYAELRGDAGLRWRRILYPLVSGLGGNLEGHALLVSMTLLAAVSFGVATAAAADLVALAGLRRWAVFGVLGNPGLLLGTMLLTPDPMALALSLIAIGLFVRKRFVATAVVLTLVALTKDQYVLVALSLAAYELFSGRLRNAATVLIPPLAAVSAWSVFLAASIGGLTDNNSSFATPFAGIAEGLRGFTSLAADERIMLEMTYAMVALAIFAVVRARFRLMRYLALPWLLAAPLLSRWVWQTGNNSLRVLLPLWFVAVVGVEEWLQRRAAAAAA